MTFVTSECMTKEDRFGPLRHNRLLCICESYHILNRGCNIMVGLVKFDQIWKLTFPLLLQVDAGE